ncbi:YchJ family protein [Paraglaciecola aestuariivivens]
MSKDPQSCFCNSSLLFTQCCQPLIENKAIAQNAEALMRSRFTAYKLQNYQYVLNTYASAQQDKLSLSELQQSAQDTQWLSLEVIKHVSQANTAQVEFKAFYKVDSQIFLMHEISDFILENQHWRYTTGSIQDDSGEIKLKRNDPCICQSNKKFKKCCGL